MTLPDIERVSAIIDDVAQTIILPRCRRLRSDEVEGKPTDLDPDDVVTVADREAERHLEAALKALAPAAVIGEEAAHEHPDLLRLVESDEPLWIIDPVDGT